MTCLRLVAVSSMKAGLIGLLCVAPVSATAADAAVPAAVMRGAPPIPVAPNASPLLVPAPPPALAPVERLLAACLPGYAREVDGRCLRHDLPRIACDRDGRCLVAPPDLLPYGQGPAVRRAY